MRGTKKLLIILGVIWVVIIIYNFGFFRKPQGEIAQHSKRNISDQNVMKLEIMKTFQKIKFDLLEKPRTDFKVVSKDIFRPLNLGMPKLKPVSSSGSGAVKSVSSSRNSKRAIPPPVLSQPIKPFKIVSTEQLGPSPNPSTPLKKFVSQARFIGFLEMNNNKTIFLSKGQDIFLLKKNDIIDELLIVKEITDATVTFKDKGSNDEITMNLTKR